MSGTWIRALALVCLFGAVVLAVEVLVRMFATSRSEGKAINLRLSMIGRGHSSTETLSLLRRSDTVLSDGLPPMLQAMGGRFERMLVQAQVTIPTGRLMLMIMVAPIGVLFVTLLLMSLSGIGLSIGRLLICTTFSIIVGAAIPTMFLNYKATRMRRKMQEQFPVSLDVFVRGLRAGHPIAAALDLLTAEMADPIGTQFGLVVDEVTYGAELRDALQNMAERWDLDDMRMFVVSLSVQSETGGNLAEILENLSRVIRERQSMMLKVRALSSEGRMTAIMLTALPILAFVSLFLMNPSFFLDVANDPAFVPGFGFLIVLYLTGFFTIRRMVDLKV
jgi:tight adherence protein B